MSRVLCLLIFAFAFSLLFGGEAFGGSRYCLMQNGSARCAAVI